MKTNVFPLSHLTLYAKNWYKRSDNIWEDLKIILEMDGYSPYTNGDVYSIIVNNFEKFEARESELRQVLTGIHPKECWKHGYKTKDNYWSPYGKCEELPEYNMPEAFIMYVVSALAFIDNTQWERKLPDYRHHKELWPEHITIRKIYEIFAKKHED